MKNVFKYFGSLTKRAFLIDKGILLFPIAGSVLWAVQKLSNISFEIQNILTIDAWINSYATTLVTYMLFDILLSKIKFFEKNKYLTAAISFLISTFIGETIVYRIYDQINTNNWVSACLTFFLGIIVLFLCAIIGVSYGAERAEKKAEKEKEQYFKGIDEMSKEDLKKLIDICESALTIDGFTVRLIKLIPDKKELFDFKEELNTFYKNKYKVK